MRKTLLVVIAGMVVGLCAQAQQEMVNLETFMSVVDTNSTLVYKAPNESTPGRSQIHYVLIENRGTTDVIFAFSDSVKSTNILFNGGTVTFKVGHCLRPLDCYEVPADKVINYPLSAITTNLNTQGLLAVTPGFKGQ